MPSTDKNHKPKPKTNEEIEAYLRNAAAGTRPTQPCTSGMLERRVGKNVTFEFRTKFQDTEYIFQAMWLDGYTGTKVQAASPNKAPPRAKAIASLIDDKGFPSVEAWVVAYRNALGENLDTSPLAGAIFIDGQCVDNVLDALLNEPASPAEDASPADDKPDDKEPASPAEDKTDDKEIAHAQVQLKYAQMFMQFFCDHQAQEQTVDA
jgi:hypothetical protein